MKSRVPPFVVDESASSFWGSWRSLVRDVVLPYQWNALNDRIVGAEPSHAIENFRIAAGLSTGDYVGMVFQDSDVGKWIEAAAYSLEQHPDPSLEAHIDETVEIMARAQAADGYLNTYFTIKEPGRRWTNLWECHELYCAGHLLEGALAYFQATGKRRFLDIMLRFVDHIDATFGPGPGKIQGYDGHEEIELALLRLHEVSGDPRHRALARFFIDQRGQEPSFLVAQWNSLGRRSHWTKGPVDRPRLEYFQAHAPVRDQTEAVGHAVRAVYLYTAMAHLATLDQDPSLREASIRLWNQTIGKQLHVTGAVGSTHHGEAFTFAYDLPPDSVYAETCASVGLVHFAQRMLSILDDARCADVAELALYNTCLASMALDGRHYFYVNPLEVLPEACERDPGKHHVKARRQAWFGCACCPPNVARLILSLGHRVLRLDEGAIHLDQFVAGIQDLGGGKSLRVETAYPQEGVVRLHFMGSATEGRSLALRRPGWCPSWTLSRQGRPVALEPDHRGYLVLPGPWQPGEEVVLSLDLSPRLVEAHPRVRDLAGRVCLMRGPLVYAVEEADQGPGLAALRIDPRAPVEVESAPDLPPGTRRLVIQGWRVDETSWGDDLYRPAAGEGEVRGPVPVVAVPYHLWGNRQPGEMMVWLHRA